MDRHAASASRFVEHTERVKRKTGYVLGWMVWCGDVRCRVVCIYMHGCMWLLAAAELVIIIIVIRLRPCYIGAAARPTDRSKQYSSKAVWSSSIRSGNLMYAFTERLTARSLSYSSPHFCPSLAFTPQSIHPFAEHFERLFRLPLSVS